MSVSIPNSTVSQREERRQTQEACVWCDPSDMTLTRGMIMNESASGVLLRTNRLLEIGQTIYILPVTIGDFSYEQTNSSTILEHPMTRSGTVVRHESENHLGIRFNDPEEGRPQFKRWFRGKATITTLAFSDRSVIHITGEFSLEASSIVQAFLNQNIKKSREIFLATQEIESISSTALALLRNSIKKCCGAGMIVTLAVGPPHSATGSLGTTFENVNNIYILQEGVSHSPSSSNDPGKSTNDLSSTRPASILIISPSASVQNRFAQPLEKLNFHVLKGKLFEDALKVILEEKPEFIIIDLEIDHCGQLLKLNELQRNEGKGPPIFILGPCHIEPLVRAALRLPVHVYVNKPITDRDFTAGLHKMLMGLPRHILDRHMQSKQKGIGKN